MQHLMLRYLRAPREDAAEQGGAPSLQDRMVRQFGGVGIGDANRALYEYLDSRRHGHQSPPAPYDRDPTCLADQTQGRSAFPARSNRPKNKSKIKDSSVDRDRGLWILDTGANVPVVGSETNSNVVRLLGTTGELQGCGGITCTQDAMIKTPLGVYPGMVSNGSDNLLPRNLVLRSGFTIQSFEKENGNCEDWIHAQDGQKKKCVVRHDLPYVDQEFFDSFREQRFAVPVVRGSIVGPTCHACLGGDRRHERDAG